ncbi:MAG: hypothetical protein N2663_06800 [Chlorobi bacterium]|nr:hypothetical protein [Chlorobiota bacterium]
MNLQAIATYQQAALMAAPAQQRRTPERQPEPEQNRPVLAPPLVVEQFTRNGQTQRIALGVHLDKRV